MGIYLNPGNEGFKRILNSIYVDKTGLIQLVNNKIDTQDNILRPFIRLRVFGKLIPQSITHYIITLKNGWVINVDDFPDYYKGKIKELDSLIWICKKSKYIERGSDSDEWWKNYSMVDNNLVKTNSKVL